MIRTLFVFGTRPEAVKLCPLILHMQSRPEEFAVRTCVTAQHRSMLDQVLSAFGVNPHHDLDLMQPGQSLSQSTARMMGALEQVMHAEEPDIVLVQGDTTSTLCGALSAFYHGTDVGHIEAGLRTGDRREPFPEEMNRVLTGRLATLHFAATQSAAENLIHEGADPVSIHVTGNTGIDAVLHVRNELKKGSLKGASWPMLHSERKLIVVTAHRRESFAGGFDGICRALLRLAARKDVQIVFPVHRNPHVLEPVTRYLGNRSNIFLIEPLDYVPFVDLMSRACLLLTDSGGIQEEGPSLGKPILVMRDKTERPEAVAAGTARLVGTGETRIFEEASALLDDQGLKERMSRVHNPYGDGSASTRIGHLIQSIYSGCRPREPRQSVAVSV